MGSGLVVVLCSQIFYRLIMKKKKPKKPKPRNPMVMPARTRKGGPMRDKRTKRQNGKNKQQEYLKEID